MRIEDRGLIFDATTRPPGERVAAFVSLCVLESGTILCGFQNGPRKHDVTSTLRLCRSRDGGQTWTEWPSNVAFEAAVASVAAPQGLAPDVPLLVGLMDGSVLRV